jgi:hypothetical protein
MERKFMTIILLMTVIFVIKKAIRINYLIYII